MTDERLTLIVETFTAAENTDTFFEQNPWIQILHAGNEYLTSYGTGPECSFTSNHFELGTGREAEFIFVKLWIQSDKPGMTGG